MAETSCPQRDLKTTLTPRAQEAITWASTAIKGGNKEWISRVDNVTWKMQHR